MKKCDKCQTVALNDGDECCRECWEDKFTEIDELPEADEVSKSAVERLVMPFAELSLGARFKYVDSEQVWIKLDGNGCGIIAEYDEKMIKHRSWAGQAICSALNLEGEKLDVVFVA